jgi:hypothetical protein
MLFVRNAEFPQVSPRFQRELYRVADDRHQSDHGEGRVGEVLQALFGRVGIGGVPQGKNAVVYGERISGDRYEVEQEAEVFWAEPHSFADSGENALIGFGR